ncbi:hypothetical protein DFH08DRAFT_970975 [Mycena albidolilacea]|uniref:Uncharacterized protein n=1 Tax=Mycena albidolilacea TaxID=1033008 RepID=A0AAD6ZF74_9AGAR|nr:hypothetical protein DFH08DRAFT_970975 [Mycena albidolilacea]
MSSEPSEESVELMVLRDVQQRIDVSAAVIMEVGNQRDNPSSGDSTTDNQSLVSLSQRISELEDHMYSAQLRTPKVKVTPWRLLNTVLVLGLGIYKATATYRGQDTTPTTLDWIIGVLWALIAYWASFLEDAHLSPGARWFFDLDVSQILWSLFLLILWPSALGLLCWGTINPPV